MADIVLINPRFELSYWGLEHALPLLGKKANLPSSCLPLLAALTPAEHEVTLMDDNVEPLDFERVAGADIVGLTGMNVQRRRMRAILVELQRRNVFTVVGGPWITVQEDAFGDLVDVIFVGEAEETWAQFLDDWRRGQHQHRYEQVTRTDMTTLPVPRYELLKMKWYLFGSVQFSRGCPFRCEFCDIIVTFGRQVRLKTPEQVLRELDALRATGMEIAFIVDDNLIGNKKAMCSLLAAVAQWQQRHGFPLTFFTEASLDLAEEPELMQLMVDANVHSVFVGIESPNEESLRETKKFQNLRRNDTMVQRVRRLQQAGLDVWCGMILGFDHDDVRIFDFHRTFLRQARILHAFVGMLSAIPKTPLHARLADAGRLDPAADNDFGTNVIPLRMERQQLTNGYLQVLYELYQPEAYFERLDALFLDPQFNFGRAQRAYWRTHRRQGARAQMRYALRALGLFTVLMLRIPERPLRRCYLHQVGRLLRRRKDPMFAFIYVLKCAMHYHHYTMATQMLRGEREVVNSF